MQDMPTSFLYAKYALPTLLMSVLSLTVTSYHDAIQDIKRRGFATAVIPP